MLGVPSLGSWWKLHKGDLRLRHDSTLIEQMTRLYSSRTHFGFSS